MRSLRSLWVDGRGSAAAEMALVTPLLLLLMFASFEVGRFFWDEHLVTKAVRDGARFAGRQSFTNMPCSGPAGAQLTEVQNVVRYGKPFVTQSDKPLLYYWTNPNTVTVTINCYDNAGTSGARVYNGIYTARPQVPRVTVSARVPYAPLLTSFGALSSGMHLNASSQAVVFGL